MQIPQPDATLFEMSTLSALKGFRGFYYSLIDWHHPEFLIDKPSPCERFNAKELNRSSYM